MEKGCHVRLHHFSQRIARQGADRQQRPRNLVGRQPFLRPLLKVQARKCKAITQLDGCRHALAPLRVLDADNRAFGNRRMRSQHLFDLECRHLEAAGLDDVDAGAAEQPVVPLFDHRDIARPEPAVAKREARFVRTLPVLAEHGRAAHLELAGRAFEHLDTVFIDDLHVHVGKRQADKPGAALAVERIRQRHAQLGHAVALEQRMPADLAPALERANRQRRRSGHHQAQRSHALGSRTLDLWCRRFPRGDQASIDRRHRREDGDLARRKAIPDDLGIELRQDLARAMHRQRASKAVEDGVDVMHRQHEQRAVVRAEAPRTHQRGDLRTDVRVAGDRTFRPAGRSARVDDHRAPGRCHVRQRAGLRVREGIGRDQETRAGGSRDRRKQRRARRMHDHLRRPRIANGVFELRRRMRGRQRHGHATGSPDALAHRDPRKAGRDVERDPRFREIGGAIEQCRSDAVARLIQLLIREDTIDGNDCGAVRTHRGKHDNARAQIHAPRRLPGADRLFG